MGCAVGDVSVEGRPRGYARLCNWGASGQLSPNTGVKSPVAARGAFVSRSLSGRLSDDAGKNKTPNGHMKLSSGSSRLFTLAASLAHPGGNVTGLADDTGPELHAKRLGLLKEMELTRAEIRRGQQTLVVVDTFEKFPLAETYQRRFQRLLSIERPSAPILATSNLVRLNEGQNSLLIVAWTSVSGCCRSAGLTPAVDCGKGRTSLIGCAR